MYAYQFSKRTGFDDMMKADLPTPRPARRQVLVKMVACSLNFRDLAIALGTYRMPVLEKLIPLSDGAGEVIEVGPDVTRVKPGDRVAGCFFQGWVAGPISAERVRRALGGSVQGLLAQYAVLDDDGVVRLPDHLSFEEGACLPCAAVTAWQALAVHGPLKPGETVLVQGTGGVSVFAMQFARMMGGQVIVISSSEEKLARAKSLGAIHGINYKARPDWDKAVLELTNGTGVDHVVEVGGAKTLERSLGSVRLGGRISVIGVLTGSAQINPNYILGRRANLQGMSVGSTEMFEAMNRAIAAARLKPVIDRVFSFDDARDAFRYLDSGAHFGKVVVRVA
jgi:NADPH:quinone reductase-like Zn-dependent oxidoreductase